MGIGTFESLSNAAQGRMAPRVYTPPVPVNSGLSDALGRRSMLGQTAAQALQGNSPTNRVTLPATTAQKLAGKDGSSQYSPVFSNILSQATRASGGLNAEGKYGGFNNAGDLQTAIEGAAISLGRTSTPQSLRAKSDAYYNRLDSMYGEAYKGTSRAFTGQGTAQMPGVNPNKQYSDAGYVGKIVNPTRQYANTLNDWYSSQIGPGEEYLQSAQQLENTPLSTLATQIATSAYGMNPDLAAGKFGALDNTYYAQQRDAASIANLGMPYAQVQDMEAAAAKEQKLIPGRFADAIETSTGKKSSALSALTAQTPEQMYATFSEDYTYLDPKDNTEVVSNGQAIVEIMKKYLETGEIDFAEKLADSLGQQDLARILNAMINLGPVKDVRTKQTNAIYR